MYDRLFLGINFMAVENTLIQIHKACELIIDFLDDNPGAVSLLGTVVTLVAAILASLLTFWFSRWSARADRERKFKDCRESFQKILPNYIKRIKEMIETLNSERIRLSGENVEDLNTGSLATGKLLGGCLSVRLILVTNLPIKDFFSYPELVEAYMDKSHKSKLKNIRKTELIHEIFSSFESIYSVQLNCINLYTDSENERIERMASHDLCFQEVWRSLNILRNMSGSIQEIIQSLEIELNLELSKPFRDYWRVNEILRNFHEGELSNKVSNPYSHDGMINAMIEKATNSSIAEEKRLQTIKLFEEASSLSDAIISYDRVFHSVMGIEKQILVNLENTHDSLESQLKHLELNFQELHGEQNGDNGRVQWLLNCLGKTTPFFRKNDPLKFFYILVKRVGFFLLYLYPHPLL